MGLTDLVIPAVIVFTALFGVFRRVDIFSEMTAGAFDGLKLMARILPNLIVLLCAVQMLRASGAMDWIASVCAPAFDFFRIPPETAPLVLIRPLSGSGALAVAAEIMSTYGVDSLQARTAAIMLGSTETTFYTIAVYFGAAGIKKTRYTIPAALAADVTGFAVAALTARIM